MRYKGCSLLSWSASNCIMTRCSTFKRILATKTFQLKTETDVENVN